jgi:cell division protease FtsH
MKLKISRRFLAYWGTFLSCYLMVSLVFYYFIMPVKGLRSTDVLSVPYTVFEQELADNNIEDMYYTSTNKYVYYSLKNEDAMYSTYNPKTDDFFGELLTHDIVLHEVSDLSFADSKEDTKKAYFSFIMVSLFIAAICRYFTKNLGSRDDKMLATDGYGDEASSNKGKKDKDMPTLSTKKFSDVAGLHEVKRDIQCLVDFLVNQDKYKQAGAKLPKGVIFYGPPGTGKTLLAKAIAGEAKVNFISMSGSEFIEMYVGVGAKRVREVFDKARKMSPCIIFIDEIDAIGGKRGGRDSNSEDRKTINALLTEMDGFNEYEGIIVIGATNRLEDLDSALVRPGRFTNKYCIPLPETAQERLEIINLYAKNKSFAEDVDFNALAKETIGFSPAKIESLLNESAIISVQKGCAYIKKEHIDAAMYKLLLNGHQKDDQSGRDEEELRIVAWHEAGHALIGYLNGKDITKVTILSSTSGAGGVTFSTPTKRGLYNIDDLEGEVRELYGGRAAERIYFKDDFKKITTGASNDIERAKEVIKSIVMKYGLVQKFGLLTFEDENQEFILKEEIDISKRLEEETFNILSKNYDKLSEIANLLLENETIYFNDIKRIFGDLEDVKEKQPVMA